MGRLIDVDEAIKQLDPNTWQGEMLITILKGLPTAYDVGKVVEQLEELIKNGYCPQENCTTGGMVCADCYHDRLRYIVKGGGQG